MAVKDIETHKFRKGESGNPAGGSRKARERAAVKSRLAVLRKAVVGRSSAPIDDRLCALVLADALNYNSDEIKRLFQQPETPHAAKVMLKAVAEDPEFALRTLQAVAKIIAPTDTEPAPAAEPTERRTLTAAEVSEGMERIGELLKCRIYQPQPDETKDLQDAGGA